VSALGKLGWVSVRQRGSHVRLKHPDRTVSLVVPLHREFKRGTMAGFCEMPVSTATSCVVSLRPIRTMPSVQPVPSRIDLRIG